ncbi:MAG: TolC family protein, partial [Alphaproteobacteria bacterium]|nr:TolC family protein [Alphaproteobacteria bacterium]
WTELGLRASWNLIGVLQAPTAIKNAEVRVDIDKMRRLALTAAVLSQVTISYGEYQQAVGVYVTAKELSDIEKKMLKISSDRERANSGTEMDLIQKRAQAIAADLSKDNALANAKAALSNLVTSIGLDIVPASTGMDNLKETTLLVDKAIRQIQNGDLDKMIELPKPSSKPDAPEDIKPASGPIDSVRNPVKAFFSQFKSTPEPIELEKMTPVTPKVSASNVKSVSAPAIKVTVKSVDKVQAIEPASGPSENPVRSFINGFKSGSNEFKMDKGVKPARAGNS